MAKTSAGAMAVDPTVLAPGMRGIAADWSSDQRAFKNVPWGKAMMWIFLLSDTFIFTCFLLSYMTVRMSKKIFHLILVRPTDRTVICDRIWNETGVIKKQKFRIAQLIPVPPRNPI
jgi:heme/copper-type cytochrome/quinol oxidase subunit 3